MAESGDEKKHATKAVTDEPQEEFIEQKARPSRPQGQTAHSPASREDEEKAS
jgi:hypothetical protein